MIKRKSVYVFILFFLPVLCALTFGSRILCLSNGSDWLRLLKNCWEQEGTLHFHVTICLYHCQLVAAGTLPSRRRLPTQSRNSPLALLISGNLFSLFIDLLRLLINQHIINIFSSWFSGKNLMIMNRIISWKLILGHKKKC